MAPITQSRAPVFGRRYGSFAGKTVTVLTSLCGDARAVPRLGAYGEAVPRLAVGSVSAVPRLAAYADARTCG